MQHLFSQFFHVGAAIGNFSPEEHTYLFFIVCTSQCMHDFPCQMAAVAVVLVISVVPFLFGFQGVGGCQLHGAEHAAVDVALHFQYPLHKVGVACQHTDTPARHIVALAHGVELDATLFGARHTEDAEGVVVQDEAVRVIVYNHDVLAACKVHQLCIKFRGGVSSGRHVRIVGPHQLYAAHVHLFQFVEVGHPAVFLFQVVVDDFRAQYLAQ